MPKWVRRVLQQMAAGINIELYLVLAITVGALSLHVIGVGFFRLAPDVVTPLLVSANLLALTVIGLGLTRDRVERRVLQASVERLIGSEIRPLAELLVPWSRHSAEFRARLE